MDLDLMISLVHSLVVEVLDDVIRMHHEKEKIFNIQ